MRLFVAVNPPPRLRRELTLRLDAVRAEVPIGWTAPDAWHLTLMFLGEWPPARLPALREALAAAAAPLRPFDVRPGAVGAFPDRRRPRVLFLHLDGGEALQRLAGAVRGAVDAVWPDGPQDRKPFRPHLTLARLRQPLAGAPLQRLRRLDLGAWEPFPVTEALLLSSDLQPAGARHRPQASLPLLG